MPSNSIDKKFRRTWIVMCYYFCLLFKITWATIESYPNISWPHLFFVFLFTQKLIILVLVPNVHILSLFHSRSTHVYLKLKSSQQSKMENHLLRDPQCLILVYS